MDKKNTLGKLKEKERETRQKIIIDAARTVFENNTYDSVSMNQIAKTAGIAKSSIYTYFSNQEALYVEVAFQDSSHYIKDLKKHLASTDQDAIKALVNHFLDYYIEHKARWRMITHFALHGKADVESLEKLNQVSRRLIDLFETVVGDAGYKDDSRLLAHAFFSALSGVLIAFRNYPGRTEEERLSHMKRVGGIVEQMTSALIARHTLCQKQ